LHKQKSERFLHNTQNTHFPFSHSLDKIWNYRLFSAKKHNIVLQIRHGNK